MATEADASTSELVAAQPTNRELHRVGGQTEDERVAWPPLAQGTYVYAGRMSAIRSSDVLYGPLDGECFTCVLKRVQGLVYPVVHVTSKPQRMTDSDIFDLVHFLERCLSAAKPCGFLHDLRHISAVSSRQQVRALVSFVARNKRTMDTHLLCTAVVVGSPLLRYVVNGLFTLFRPSQPASLFGSLEEAIAFLGRHISPGAVAAPAAPSA